MPDSIPDFALGMAADEEVAKTSAALAVETANRALDCYELRTITIGEMLAGLVKAGGLASRAYLQHGWAFLGRKKP